MTEEKRRLFGLVRPLTGIFLPGFETFCSRQRFADVELQNRNGACPGRRLRGRPAHPIARPILPLKPDLRLHPEQARRVEAEDRRLLLIAQRRGGEDVVHRMLLPRDRMVGAEHDLARAHLRHEVTQRLGGEYQGIEIELIEVFARLLLQLQLDPGFPSRRPSSPAGLSR
jgi:hypothetical protein